MEKLVIKGKKEVKNLLVDSLHQTVQALGVAKSKKKTSKLIDKSAKRIAELVSTQMKKEQKKFKTVKAKKVKHVEEPVLEKA